MPDHPFAALCYALDATAEAIAEAIAAHTARITTEEPTQ